MKTWRDANTQKLSSCIFASCRFFRLQFPHFYPILFLHRVYLYIYIFSILYYAPLPFLSYLPLPVLNCIMIWYVCIISSQYLHLFHLYDCHFSISILFHIFISSICISASFVFHMCIPSTFTLHSYSVLASLFGMSASFLFYSSISSTLTYTYLAFLSCIPILHLHRVQQYSISASTSRPIVFLHLSHSICTPRPFLSYVPILYQHLDLVCLHHFYSIFASLPLLSCFIFSCLPSVYLHHFYSICAFLPF